MPNEKPASGKFCWNELMTRDTEGSSKFYSELLGWKAVDSEMPGMPYTLWKHEGADVGGMMKMPEDLPAAVPPHWMSYVAVDDVDALANRVNDLGGMLLTPPYDIPHVGRFCIVQDPSGATLGLITFPG
jgi:predicted enzyme related to lactoylglutathione lyase